MALRLTPNQKAQSDFLLDQQPGETAYISGWGGGKTWAGARKLLLMTSKNQCPSLAVAPTYGDLGRVVVPALYEACTDFGWSWKDQSRSPDRPCVIVGDEWTIHTMSAEKPQRFAGFEVGAIWIDEAARIRTSNEDPLMDAPMQIRSRLRHPDAQKLHLMVTTTPEGQDTWVERDFAAPERRLYRGSTLLNEHLPQSYIDRIKASLPPELLDQYLHGVAVSYVADRAHPQWSDSLHMQAIEPNPSLPVHMCADFNVSPMHWVLFQQDGDNVRVFDEVYIEDGATVEMSMRRANQQQWGRFPLVHLHLDRSAKNRSTVGPAQFDVITTEARRYGWNITGNVDGVNPPINARIDRLSTQLMSGDGVVGLTVHPRCKSLIYNFGHTARGSNGYNPGRDGKLGHGLDALGYGVWDIAKPQKAAAVSWF